MDGVWRSSPIDILAVVMSLVVAVVLYKLQFEREEPMPGCVERQKEVFFLFIFLFKCLLSEGGDYFKSNTHAYQE